jgi:hypothetical protein
MMARWISDGLTCADAAGTGVVSYPESVEDGDYVVTINDRRCVVWTPQEWVAGSPWAVATVRPPKAA